MQAFITEAQNRPGEFARHTEAIASRGINLASTLCLGLGERGGAAFIAADEAGLRSALSEAGIGYREVSVVAARLKDEPGAAASAARRLADAGVNIELFVPVDGDAKTVTVAIGVDKVDEAHRALGDLSTEWSMTGMAGAAR